MSRHSRKSVRFDLPTNHIDEPPSILRRQTRGNLDLDYGDAPPSLTRRSSLPSTVMSHASRIRGIEAMHGLRDYIKDACNFHGEQFRRALSVPSVNALCELTAFIANLRGDSRSFTTADERVLHRVLDCARQHPHEQLAQPDDPPSRHARNAMRAHGKRARREADFHLLQFTARQLALPARALKELSTRQRHARQLEAFKQRILKFYGPNHGGVTSAPQSPAGRPLTAPRSPVTDPIRWETQHGRFPDDMQDLSLPASYDPRVYATGRPHVPPTPPQRPVSSPYMPVQTPPQHFQASPYVYPGVPVGGYQHTPPQPPVSVPYGTAYAQQYHSTGQTFAPLPMNIPQSVNTPTQNVQPAPQVPVVSMPPSMTTHANVPHSHAHTPLQTTLPTPHTPQQQPLPAPQQPLPHMQMPQPHTPQQQQPLPHPTPGSTNPNLATPIQSLPPTPMQQVLPPSQQQQHLHQVPHMQAVPVQQVQQTVPVSGSFVLPVPTAVPAVLPTVQYPQQFPQQFPQQQVQGAVHGQAYPAGYQQQQYQYAQEYQSRRGQQPKGG